ncbi:MAG: molecular chaperone HscC [Parasphingorhabdus sp.]
MALVGIDLGTTNSAVAVWRDGQSELIPNSMGDLLTPSAVSISEDGELFVGMIARERQSTHPDCTATGFKRLIGTEHKFNLAGRSYTPEDLSSRLLHSLKTDAEIALGETIDEAIITVPAYFNDKQRRATQRAADMAGLKVGRLLNEPTAAALGYGIHKLDDDSPFLVFDLGGGTFDVSIVEIFEGIIEVRSSSGDPRLGGIDFNELIAFIGMNKFDEDFSESMNDPALKTIVMEASERTRRTLSDADEATFRFVWQGKEYSEIITTLEFEKNAEPLLTRLKEPILRSLRDGNLRADMLGEVILVGGATRMPIIRKVITRLFGRFPNHSLHPDHAVALGAAVQAGLRAKDSALEELRMTDVCPFTLGVDTTERDQFGGMHFGVFAPIIERNRPIPSSVVRPFSTLEDNQRQVTFGIYQGEARNVADNVKLGMVDMKVPPKLAGEIEIQCRFSYDVSGLLEVDVTVPETGQTKQMLIGQDVLDDNELQSRREILEKLKIHPRKETRNSAVISRGKRLYESLIGEMREHVGQLITGFEAVLDKQDQRAIEAAYEEVQQQLDQIEGERYL